MNFSEKDNDFKQVRTFKGGGTRHVSVDRYTTVRDIQEMAQCLFFPNGQYKSLKLTDHVCSICDFSLNEVDQECAETEVITIDLSHQESHVIQLDEDIFDMQMLGVHSQDEGSERGINVVEVKNNENLEMESSVIEQQEDQDEGVTDVISVAQEVENQFNTSTDDEVTVGASLGDSFAMDDTLPWEGPKPKFVVVLRKSNCFVDLLAAFTDPEMMNKEVFIKRKLLNGKLEEGEGSGVFRDCL
ncbi:hypothetical protein GOODEAATRI_033823 [Goodea atripinnis]|uniref:Uncharacterized protein n=1 Tax=Goodea atripinnis TaxID=208336 RepID=A0ABV0MMV6_9TELE